MTSLESWREARIPKSRGGKREENGLVAHLMVIHEYSRNSLSGLEIIQLVFKHQRERRHAPDIKLVSRVAAE